MIKHKFQYRKNGLRIDFNWKDSVVPCKEVRITLNKTEVILSRAEFSTLMAVFADEQQMEDLMPTKKTKFVSVERMLKLKATKDIKKGEYLTSSYVYWLPKTEYDALKADGQMIKMVKKDIKELKKIVSENEAAKSVKQLWNEGKLVV